ncbi:MAG: hypothetical protein L6R40_000354 [Gallowayella cf. fulva]|nr:MAG: hypothetical protein L6R40_000354 [Xanthomendoza cf. fulva]
MNSKLAALILGAMATLTFASPIASEAAKESINQAATAGSVQELAIEASPEAAQDVTNILVCINANFSGRCERLRNTKGNCYNLYNGFDNEISSVGPDSGTTCELFDDKYCTGSSVPGIVAPGIYHLSDYGFNDRASSYRCQ